MVDVATEKSRGDGADDAIIPIDGQDPPAPAIMWLATAAAEDPIGRLPLHVRADVDLAPWKKPDAAGKRGTVAGGSHDEAEPHGRKAAEASGKARGGCGGRGAPG